MPGRLLEPPAHGTRKRYQWRLGKCHCAECRLANRIYVYSRRYELARSGHDQPLPLVASSASGPGLPA